MKWTCHTENGWISYSSSDSANIEAAYKANLPNYDFDINGNAYRIDFSKMEQKNRKTNNSRPVQRLCPNVLLCPADYSLDRPYRLIPPLF